jgi:hypothetical protein
MMEPNPPADIDGIVIEEASLPARVGAAETNLRPQNDEADLMPIAAGGKSDSDGTTTNSSKFDACLPARNMVVASLTRVTKQDAMIRGRWQVGINASNLHAYLDYNPHNPLEGEEA